MMGSERDSRIKALKKLLEVYGELPKILPFEDVIEAWYGNQVLEFNSSTQVNTKFITKLNIVMSNILNSPFSATSPINAGNIVDQLVLTGLNNANISAATPKTQHGNSQSSGYPDISITHPGTPIYLEVKSYSKKTANTTQRSFYLSPSDNPKVTKNAHHLLVGFELKKTNSDYTPVAYKIIDLFGMPCSL